MSGSALLGKIALVTGGSGTIGLAIAKALLSQGASVVLAGRRLEKLEEARTNLLSYYPEGNSVSIVSCDVSKEDSVVKLFETSTNNTVESICSSTMQVSRLLVMRFNALFVDEKALRHCLVSCFPRYRRS
jgi:NAD(P)-dependent dehydrogenase (short-subunit alcohol dehydrogenase family)